MSNYFKEFDENDKKPLPDAIKRLLIIEVSYKEIIEFLETRSRKND